MSSSELLCFFLHCACALGLQPHVRSQTPEVTMGVLHELMRRGALKPALAGRDTHQVQALLRFIQRQALIKSLLNDS